jgi:glycosyltransferase involved in cell wall biosynthesis
MTVPPLRVGILAPPWVPVPPSVYGGTELVLDELALGLTRAGCEVHLFATGDSTCPVPRSWLYERALGTVAELSAEAAHIARGYGDLAGMDIIHDHTLTGPVWGAARVRGPRIVTTVHGQLTEEMRARYEAMAAAGVAIIAISETQRRSAPTLPVAAVIHHGLDVSRLPFGTGDGGYVLFLGRMNPDKGAHRAIAVARAAGRRILLAAKMWEPEELRSFHDLVEPMLDEDAVYLGEVASERKLELLAGAAVLINPIRWPEPFGLVMIEALACGTPVLAFPEGAAPEIVEHGHTGFLCDDEADMVRHVDAAAGLDRAACRAAVAERFSNARMVEAHVALYRQLLSAPWPAVQGA